ncbi:MAG: toxin-antitoxin system HicB family antitoxin [Syntrophobacteraceae bacterium]
MKAITVRVPQSLHAELIQEAEYEGVSLNLLCVTKLARPLDWYRQRDAKEVKDSVPHPEVLSG